MRLHTAMLVLLPLLVLLAAGTALASTRSSYKRVQVTTDPAWAGCGGRDTAIEADRSESLMLDGLH